MQFPLRPEVERAFAAVIDLSAPEQQAFLAREYPQDPELQAEVASLLKALAAAGDFLDGRNGPRVLAELMEAISDSPLPASIGKFRIIRLLGEGGMGAVYEAQQSQPRRSVALKVGKSGVGTPELAWRFEREAHMLARLHHPNIAQIYETGTAETPWGAQPLFAMELIQGQTLLRYADANGLNTAQRLEIMAKVCDGVHHAHQAGIVHRDLKPSNILVEASGEPKIVDFGVARITATELELTRQTELGQIVGTLAYMSPEQVLGDPSHVDTRTDVYALGVILFELLAGRLPYQVTRDLCESARTIRNIEPPRLGSIDRNYRGDIETIVSKALEKEKERRYSSAAELGADIRRYLSDQPIVARPATLAYQAWKFTRRHRPLVAGTLSVFAILVFGIVMSTREAMLARRAGLAALSERNRAVAEKERADKESAAAKAVSDFLENDVLAQASANVQARPDIKPDPGLKVRTALDRAAARISTKFQGHPLLEASIRRTIGRAYRDLGLYPEAVSHLQRALELQRRAVGEQAPEYLETVSQLAEVRQYQGQYSHAAELFATALRQRQRVLGTAHPDTLASMNGLAAVYRDQGEYARAEPLYVEVLKVRGHLLGELHPETLASMNNLGLLYLDEGKYAQAEPLCNKVFAERCRVLGKQHPDTLISEDNVGRLLLMQGKYPQAEALFAAVLAMRRQVLGAGHPDTLQSMNSLAVVYRREGKLSNAEPLLKSALQAQRIRMGEDHPDTLLMMNNLARVYIDQGQYARADTLLSRTLQIQRHRLGENHPDTLTMMRNLAHLQHLEGRSIDAERLLTQVVDVRRKLLGAAHPETLNAENDLAELHADEGHFEKAEPLYLDVLESRRRILGPEHLDTVRILASLGDLRLRQRKYTAAEALLRQALHGQTQNNSTDWRRFETESLLGAALCAQARFEEAEPLLLAGYEGLLQSKAQIPWESRKSIHEAVNRIVRLYEASGNVQKAAVWRKRLTPG